MKANIELVVMPYGNLSRRWVATLEIEGDEQPVCCQCGQPFLEDQNAWLIGNNKLNCLRNDCVDEHGMPLGTEHYGHCKKSGKDQQEDFFILIKLIKRAGV